MIVHASSVDIEGQGILILGKAGSGKSSLALQLMALGACLVADDRVVLKAEEGGIQATAAPNLAGLIEARGIGILRARHVPQTQIRLAVDMDTVETDRMPEPQFVTFLGIRLPLLHKVENSAFPSMILQYLKGGRAEI